MNRRNTTLLALLAICLPLLPGCIVVSKHETHRHEPTHTCEPGVVYAGDDAIISEIEAARSLSFSSERADHLGRIAGRPGLDPGDQVYLVDTALDALSFESEQMGVLTTLIRNPSFTSAGKSRILERLGDLSFSSNRKQILNELDQRGPVYEPVVYEEPEVYAEHEVEVRVQLPVDEEAAPPVTE